MENQTPLDKTTTCITNEVTTTDDLTTPGCRCISCREGGLTPDPHQSSPEEKSDGLDLDISASSSTKKSVSFGSETEIGLAHPYNEESEECIVIKHASEHPPTPRPSISALSRCMNSEEDLPTKPDEKLRGDSCSIVPERQTNNAILYMVTELTRESDFFPHDEKSKNELSSSRVFSKETLINGEIGNCGSFSNKQRSESDLALLVAEEVVQDVCRKLVVMDLQEMRDTPEKGDPDRNPCCQESSQEEMHLSLISNNHSRRQITPIEEEDSNELEQTKSFENTSTSSVQKRLSNVTITRNSVGCEEISNSQDLDSNLQEILEESTRKKISQTIDAPPNDSKRELSFQNDECLLGNVSESSNVRVDKRMDSAFDRISELKDFLVEMRNQIMEEDKHAGETSLQLTLAADNVSGGFDTTDSKTFSSTIDSEDQLITDLVCEETIDAEHELEASTSPKKSVDVEEKVVAANNSKDKTKMEDAAVPDLMTVEGIRRFSFQPPEEEGSVTAAGEGSRDERHHLAPVLEGREIGLNEDLVRGSLSVFSVKGVAEGIRTSSKVQPTAPPFHEIAERYSFGNLWRPEISKIECLKACGKESLEGILESACKKNPSAMIAHQDDSVE